MMLGVVSLLVVLALVGLLTVRQMRKALPPAAAAASAAQPAGNVREQAQQLQNQVAADVNKALQQGSQARRDAPEQ